MSSFLTSKRRKRKQGKEREMKERRKERENTREGRDTNLETLVGKSVHLKAEQ